ncbi:MAG TPA: AMP-binding protein [Candidatus Dormibacteraeota bacterium]|nr:AMP-binding protein [Candidatus Dormibacteraeota bacterium]
MPRENLLSLFSDFAKHERDIAVVQRAGYRRESWTYAQLVQRSFLCAQNLRAREIRTGDRVLLWGHNSAEWMAAFWGCLLVGAVAVPMDEGATPAFVTRVVKDAAVKLIVSDRAKQEVGLNLPSAILEDLSGTVDGKHYGQSVPRGTTFRALGFADERITRGHIAEILFTSGTTAEPRGVVLTHGNFLANLEPLERGIAAYRKWERWFHPLRFVTLVPLSHVFGQFMALFVPPLMGATVVFELSANAGEIIRTVKRECATALIAVPRQLDMVRSGIERHEEALGRKQKFIEKFNSVRDRKFLRRAAAFHAIHRRLGWKFWCFISGGAALSSDTEKFFKGIGYAVVQGYGMTETASLISLNHPFRSTENSVGKVLPGREFRLAEDGEILVRGNNVASSYWEHGGIQSATEQGWLHTGDLGEMDAAENLRFRGRKKNVIVTAAGLNVHPEDLEAALRGQPGVRDCVVVPSPRYDDAEPCAVLLLAYPPAVPVNAIIDRANETLAEYQRMRDWVVWPEPDFPRTPTGKPRLKEIISAVTENTRESTGIERKNVREQSASNSVAEVVRKFSGTGSGNGESDDLLNLTSLDRVELMSVLEERFNVELDETAFAQARTTAEVESLLQRPGSRRAEYTYPRWAQREPVLLLRLAAYYLLVWPATQILGHPKTVGSENLDNLQGPAIFVSNHITRRADIGLILAALPSRHRNRLATAMGGETLLNMRHPPSHFFFAKKWAYRAGYWLTTALFNVFPLPQNSGFRESFRFAGESIDRGYSILIFPEGEVSSDGTMAPFQSGIGLLAQNLRVPIVPMRLDGVWAMKREKRRLAHFGEITVRIGAPVSFPVETSAGEIAEELEKRVRGL